VAGFRPDGACDYLSEQWLSYTGVAEVEQLRWGWLEQVHPDDRERVRDQWKSTLKSGRRGDVTFRIRSARGGYHRFATRWIPIADPGGHVAKWYATSIDVDELEGMESET
jgi:PAS domain-containing protein